MSGKSRCSRKLATRARCGQFTGLHFADGLAPPSLTVHFGQSRRFGEDAAQDMVEWAEEHFPQTAGRILDGTFHLCSPSTDRPCGPDLLRSESIATTDSPRGAFAPAYQL